MKRILAILLAIALALPGTAFAQPQRIDDTGSQVLGGLVRMQWESETPSATSPNMLQGQITVLVRLDMSPWLGQRGRVYHVLSKQPTPVEARWTTRGVLLPGTVRDGERTLVYAGTVSADRLEDTFTLLIRANGDLLSQPEQLEFSFEFEPEGS